jgi:subtilisin family serine protease
MSVELLGPNGRSLLHVQPGESKGLTSAGRTVVMVANRQTDPNNGDNTIGVFLEGGLPSGRWTVRLHALAVINGRYHAWIERDDAGQSQFPEPHDNSHTIGSISCGRETIVVGSYDAHKPELPLSWFSSAGPTRDGRHKPEISAPGHDVMAAWSRTKNKAIRKSGTSMAAPAVSGCIALALSEAAVRGKILSNAEIRDAVVSTARANPPLAPWDGRYGEGRVSASAMVAKAIALAPAAPTPPPKPAKKKKKKK